LNGKFDLTSAEGLADLIEAETMWQHKQAIKQMNGELEKLYDKWREKLLTTISLLEAYIDFPDEDIPEEVLTRVLIIIEELKNTITNHLNDNRRGELLRNGLKLIILGAPNVGKSSLLNFLMQRDVAIVSDIAGTTRDIIEGHLDIGGYPIIVQDTAGIRSKSNDLIEQEGINRAIKSAQFSDIKIIMIDASKPDYSGIESLIDDKTILVINKIDLSDGYEDQVIKYKEPIRISLKDNVGLNLLLKGIENIANNIAGHLDSPQITRERHRYQLEQALKYLANCNIKEDLVLATEDIRMTIRALSCITGKITVDEIIGEIFSNFCIGK
jgi:tRNA modification GTPase